MRTKHKIQHRRWSDIPRRIWPITDLYSRNLREVQHGKEELGAPMRKLVHMTSGSATTEERIEEKREAPGIAITVQFRIDKEERKRDCRDAGGESAEARISKNGVTQRKRSLSYLRSERGRH